MSDLAITAATAILGSNTASGDLFPVVDVSASTPKGRSITRDELGTAMVATSALTTALAAKLDLAGGTMTGALVITQGTANASVLTSSGHSLTGSNATGMIDLAGTWNTTGTPTAVKLNITDTASNASSLLLDLQVGGSSKFKVDKAGSLRLNGDSQDTVWRRSDVGMLIFHGQSSNSTGIGAGGYNPGVNLGSLCSVRWTNDSPAASADLILKRSAAAVLQMGDTHATTPTAQTIKAHNVTTGSGAALVLCGGTGSVAGGSVKLAAPSTTGAGVVAVEVGAGGLLGFFGAGPQAQPATGGSSAAFVENTGTALNENSTFDSYTIAQVVLALRNLGLLA